jgi:hypothetical protein
MRGPYRQSLSNLAGLVAEKLTRQYAVLLSEITRQRFIWRLNPPIIPAPYIRIPLGGREGGPGKSGERSERL